VLRRMRAVLGGDLRFLVSGSAPMPLWLLERLHAMGFLVLEAYGMSESIVPVAANRPQRYRFGTVGQPLAGSEVRLADDGELLLRGPGVFAGCLGGPPEADRIDGRGFLASGDYASIDAEGFITLVGRKSDLFKTSTGRRIAPASIESRLRRIPYVEHAVVVGANRPFLSVVLAVAEPSLRNRLGGQAPGADPAHTAAVVRADVMDAAAELPAHEQPAGIVLTTHPFTVADGLVTANLKVRRSAVQAAYGARLDELYRAAVAAAAARPTALAREGGAVLLIAA
jgi:long-chain acyl-CoA synthetase